MEWFRKWNGLGKWNHRKLHGIGNGGIKGLWDGNVW
jgi:hypothetical protein